MDQVPQRKVGDQVRVMDVRETRRSGIVDQVGPVLKTSGEGEDQYCQVRLPKGEYWILSSCLDSTP